MCFRLFGRGAQLRLRVLALADGAPGVHDQGDSDNAVGDEHAEVLADGGVAEHGAARAGDDDEQQV